MPTDLTFDIRLLSTIFGGAASAPASTLLNGLVSYWTLDEVSGTRKDSIVASGNDLTDNNTVGSAAGVNNLAASFVAANGESLTATAFLGTYIPSGSLSLSMWMKENTAGVTSVLARQAATGSTTDGFWLTYSLDTPNAIDFYLGSGTNQDTCKSGAFTSTDFHHILAEYDKDAGTMTVYVDNVAGTPRTMQYTPLMSGATFYLGSYNGTASLALDGLLDEVAIWSRVLTDPERTELYAAGAGKFYPFA